MYMKVSGVPILSRISKRSKESSMMSIETRIQEGYYQRGLLDAIGNIKKSEDMEIPSDIPKKYAALYRSGYIDAK